MNPTPSVTHVSPAPRASIAEGPSLPTPRHATVLEALESPPDAALPYVTFWSPRGPERMDRRGALESALRWARALSARGVRAGDPVAILLPTGPAFVGALFGTMLLRGLPVPLASPLAFGGLGRYLDNLEAVARDAGARCLLTTPRVRDALATAPGLRAVLREVLTEADIPGAGEAHGPGRPLPSVGEGDTAVLQYTSGTTGRPRGVVVSHRALARNAAAIAHALRLGPDDVGVSWLPLFHDMGLVGALLTAACHPYPLHVMPPDVFLMHPHRWLMALSEARGTVSAAPNFGYELCTARAADVPGLDLSRWRAALTGAEPVRPATVKRFCARFGAHGFDPRAVRPVYGLAESTLAVTFTREGSALETLGAGAPEGCAADAVCVGGPVAGAAVSVRDAGGAVLPEGSVGEVCVAGASLMDGYYRNEAESERALRGGVLHTGDLGVMRAGELFVVGRAKEVIIKAGRNVYPYDLERVAAEVPGLHAGGVAAFARRNPETGTDDAVVVAETLVRDAAERERIVRAVRGEILATLDVKVDEVHLWPVGSLPRTTSGKVRRRSCAELLTPGRA